MVSEVGWRSAYLLQAGVMAALVLPLAALFRGAEQTPIGKATTDRLPARDWSVAEAIRTRHFWLLFIVYGLTSIGSFLVSLHQLAFAVDRGFDPLYAAFVVGLGSLLALPGVILTGTISDYIGREGAAILAYVISIIGVAAALLIDSADQHLLFWVHACFFGITWGARGPAVTAKTADLFGDHHWFRFGRWAWRLGRGVSVRPDRQLSAWLHALNRGLHHGRHCFLGPAEACPGISRISAPQTRIPAI
jgi:nitrate/nitrite transporter NarK